MLRRLKLFALVLAMVAGVAPASADGVDPWQLILDGEETQRGLEAAESVDPSSPVNRLTGAVAFMEGFLARPPAGTPQETIDAVEAALARLHPAANLLKSGSGDLSLIIEGMARAAAELEGLSGDDAGVFEDKVNAPIRGAGREFAVGTIGQAERGGVGRTPIAEAQAHVANGDLLGSRRASSAAVIEYGKAVEVGGLLHFDIELFEQNIVNVVGPNSVGYAYAINQGGQLWNDDAGGKARTDADDPETDASPLKEHFLASVSKTITGVALQRALQDFNIPVSTPISGFLPPYWPKGTNVGSLTFEHLLTHRSGFLTSDGNVYEALKAKIAGGLPSLPDGYDYSNANFGMMRILIPRITGVLDGLDPWIFAYPFLEGSMTGLYAIHFQDFVKTKILQPIGIDGNCYNVEADETRYYQWPDTGNAGYDEPNRLMSCGGFGWFLSARELAAFMAHLRYTNTLLSASSKQQMDQKYLGWLDAVQWDDWTVGSTGLIYHNHGGDWNHGPGDSHTCIMKFPINVEVSLVINSAEGFPGHQCLALRNAYDNAWVTN